MKKQLHQLRRFFVKTKKYNATATARNIPAAFEEEDDGSNRLSGAFFVVLALHVIAIVGVFAFTRIKDNRANNDAVTKVAPKAAPVPTPVDKKPAETTRPAPVQFARTHVVKSGENLTRIAMAYSVNTVDLVAANQLKSVDDLRIGQVLGIPGVPETRTEAAGKVEPSRAEVAETKPAVVRTETKPTANPTNVAKVETTSSLRRYTVQKGDSLIRIAREHGCSYEELVKLNAIKDPKKLQPGQTLKIPGTKRG